MGAWVYQRMAPAEFRRLPYTTWEKFLKGEASLSPSGDGFVWTASIWLAMKNRRVTGLYELSLAKHRVTPEGIHDEAMQQEGSRAAIHMVWEKQAEREEKACASSAGTEATRSLVDAKARFEYNRFRWKPTPADKATLCALVNQRAGWAVLTEESFERAK